MRSEVIEDYLFGSQVYLTCLHVTKGCKVQTASVQATSIGRGGPSILTTNLTVHSHESNEADKRIDRGPHAMTEQGTAIYFPPQRNYCATSIKRDFQLPPPAKMMVPFLANFEPRLCESLNKRDNSYCPYPSEPWQGGLEPPLASMALGRQTLREDT